MQDTTPEPYAPNASDRDDTPATFTAAGVRTGLLTMLPLTPGNFAHGLVFGVLAGVTRAERMMRCLPPSTT